MQSQPENNDCQIVRNVTPVVFNNHSSKFEYTSFQDLISQPLPPINDVYANHAHPQYNPKLFKQLQSSFVYEYYKDQVNLVEDDHEKNYDLLMGVEVPSCGIYFQSGQNKNLRDELEAFIKKHAISMSNAKTEQQNFLKFSHNSEETLKKYSDFKVGEITYFLRATYHYKELNVWRPEDLRAQEWVKSRLKWVVMEKYVNHVIAAMCVFL